MYMTSENHSPSLLGVDVLCILSIHLRTAGFSLALLPDWLWLELDLWPGAELVLVGKVGTILLLGHRLKHSKRRLWQLGCWREGSAFHLRLGRVWFTIERRPLFLPTA